MDLNVNVKITAPAICEALKELAMAYAGRTKATATEAAKNLEGATMGALDKVTAPVQSAPTAPVTPAQPAAPVPPTNPPTPVTPPAPAAPVAPEQAAPTAPAPVAPTVTLDKIKAAGAGLAAQGKTAQLMELITKYGVKSILDLKPTQFDAMAADLVIGASLAEMHYGPQV